MAYFLYITRPPHFASRIRRRITPEAWESLFASDSALIPCSDSPATAAFLPAPGRPLATLLYKEGNILCKNPDHATVDKLVAIANALEAVVQGEDGEIHSSSFAPPHLTQFALWDRPSRRLRIRFPANTPPTQYASLVFPPIYAADSQFPETIAVEPSPAEVEPPALIIRAPRVRMPIGFPSPSHQPSPALRGLLNPLRPAQM